MNGQPRGKEETLTRSGNQRGKDSRRKAKERGSQCSKDDVTIAAKWGTRLGFARKVRPQAKGERTLDIATTAGKLDTRHGNAQRDWVRLAFLGLGSKGKDKPGN